MDQVWKGLSNLDPRDPGGFYKKPLLTLTTKSKSIIIFHANVWEYY